MCGVVYEKERERQIDRQTEIIMQGMFISRG